MNNEAQVVAGQNGRRRGAARGRGHGRGVAARVNRGARNRVSNADRQRLVEAHENNEDVMQLADRLHINRDTARSVIRVWMLDARVDRLPLGGRRLGRLKMDQEMVDQMLIICQERPFSTLVTLNEELRRRLPNKPHVCPSTIARYLDQQLITLKLAGKDADVPFQRNTQNAIERRFEHATWLTNLPANHCIIYIDETGFNVFQRRSQGRAPVGEPIRREVNIVRVRNINIIIAINAELGLIYFAASQETLNHQRYQNFINELIRHAAPMFPDHVHIVHDGARPHLNTIVEEEFANQFDVRVQPPYSPFYNPVEQAHSCIKAAIGRQLVLPRIQEQLLDAENRRQADGLNLQQWKSRILLELTHQAMAEITQQKCVNWCNRVHRYVPRSLARQDIQD